jgi:hypothetical protein
MTPLPEPFDSFIVGIAAIVLLGIIWLCFWYIWRLIPGKVKDTLFIIGGLAVAVISAIILIFYIGVAIKGGLMYDA